MPGLGRDTLLGAIGFLSAYHVAEKLRIPFVPAFLQHVHPTRRLPCMPFPETPAWLPEGSPLHGAYNLSTYWFTDKVLGLLRRITNQARGEALGLPPMRVDSPFKKIVKRRQPCLYGFSETVLPKPPDWGSHLDVTDYWFLDSYESWRPPEGLEDFLEAGPAPVCVGFGSMNERDPEETTKIVLEALTLAGHRGILLTGWGGLGNADLPDEVFKVEEVPHDWLFPRVAAAVHHGGAGTTAASLSAGTPTVIVPFIGDQAMWGRRVHALGAGPEPIPRGKLSAEGLAEAIRAAAADDAVRERAAAVAQLIRAEDGVERAVEGFCSSVAGGRV